MNSGRRGKGLDIFSKPIIVQHVPFRLDILIGDHLIVERHNGNCARAIAAELVEQRVVVGGIDLQIARQSFARLLRTVEQPVLIHCHGGADRTGLASALYELLIARKPADEAAGQLSFAYGHFPWLGSDTVAMDRAFWRVAEGEITP